MKELNIFRQFISEDKISEDKIEKVIKDTLKKEGGASGLDPLKKAVKALNVDTDLDVEKFISKMDNVEKHKDGDYILTPLKENDIVLDEVINEGIKSAAKEFVDFHVDGNDNEGVQQVTFDEKEYLEPGEYRKGTVKHFKELQNYLNKNKKYEYTSPGGVKYIFTLSGKNIKLKG